MVISNPTPEEEQTAKYLEYKGTLSIKIGETLLQLRKQCRSLEHFYKYAKEELDLERNFVDRAVHASVIAYLVDKNLANEDFREGAFPLVVTEHQTRNIPQFLIDHKIALDPSVENLELSVVNVEDDNGKEAILRIWKEAVKLANGPPTPNTVERATQKILSKFYPYIHRKYKEHQAVKQKLEEEEQERIAQELKKKKIEYYQYLRNAGKKLPEEVEKELEEIEQASNSHSSKRAREESEESPAPKRKRGRPPKNPERRSVSPQKRGPGRPPKSASSPKSSSTPKRGPGRPPKNPNHHRSTSVSPRKEPVRTSHGAALTRKQEQLQGRVTRTTARELGLEARDLLPASLRRTPSPAKRPVGRPASQPNPKTKPLAEDSRLRTPSSEPPKRKRGRPPKRKFLRATQETSIAKDLPYQRTPDSHSRQSSSRSTEEEDSFLEPSQHYNMELDDPRPTSPSISRKPRTHKDDLKAMAAHITQLQKKLKDMERVNRSLQHQIMDSEEQLSSMKHLMDRITTHGMPASE